MSSACQVKGCPREAHWHPRIVFHVVHGERTWTLPAIVGLVVCTPHRATIREPTDILGDGGAKLIQAIEGMRSGAKVERVAIDFLAYDSPDAITFRSLQNRERPS